MKPQRFFDEPRRTDVFQTGLAFRKKLSKLECIVRQTCVLKWILPENHTFALVRRHANSLMFAAGRGSDLLAF
jgi:hypothetical protein